MFEKVSPISVELLRKNIHLILLDTRDLLPNTYSAIFISCMNLNFDFIIVETKASQDKVDRPKKNQLVTNLLKSPLRIF